MWFFISLLGYFFLALVFLLDKVILTKSVPKPALYTFYSTIFLLPLFFLFPFGVEMLEGISWLLAAISGVSFGLALWTGFIAMKHGEVSHMGPFMGACITIASFFLGAIFLGEILTLAQQVGMGILILSSLLLSFEKSKKHNGFHRGFLWGILAGALFGISHVSAKYVYEVYPFLSGLVWTKGFTGIFGLIFLLFPSVQRILFSKHRIETKIEAKKRSKKNVKTTVLVIINKVLSVVANLLIQYAIAIGSVTLVNAMSGVQYACLFLLVVLFSRYGKKYFQEYFTKREFALEIVAVLLVIMGAALFVF